MISISIEGLVGVMITAIVAGAGSSFGIMFCILNRFGIWGWFTLPVVLPLTTVAVLFVLLLPCYIEEQRMIKKFRKEWKSQKRG